VTSGGGHGEFVMAAGKMSGEFTAFLAKTCTQIATALVDGASVTSAGLAAHGACAGGGADGGHGPGQSLRLGQASRRHGSFYRSRQELVFVLNKGSVSHVNAVELGKNGRNRCNVWAYEGLTGFGADKAREREMHPTEKPLALLKDAILDASRQGARARPLRRLGNRPHRC